MPPQEGCAIYKRPPDKRSTVFFLCRKRHGYTRDLRSVCGNKRYRRSFNAASGNAIRATGGSWIAYFNFLVFQCRKRQCYTRDSAVLTTWSFWKRVSMPQAAMLYARRQRRGIDPCQAHVFQCRKRQCYTRDSVSRGPHNCWAHTEIFTTFPFFLEIGAFFEDTVFSKSPKTSCYPLISKGLSCPRFFVATSPVFRDKNEKIISSPSIASIRIRGKKFVACRRFCRSGVCVMVS